MTMQEIIERYEVRAEATAMRPTVFDDADGTEKEYAVNLYLVSAKGRNGKRKSHVFPLINSSGLRYRSNLLTQDILLNIVARAKCAEGGFFADWQRLPVPTHEKHCPARLRFYLDSNCHEGLRELFDESTLRDLYGIFSLPEAKEENTQQPMTDDEYAAAREDTDARICPFCRSGINVTVVSPLSWDERYRTTGLATTQFYCGDCKRPWTEILRPIAYEHEGA